MGVLKNKWKASQPYPSNCEINNKLDWMFKGNCVACIKQPIESGLSVAEYRRKYPVEHTLVLGAVEVDLCDYHMQGIKNYFKEQE